VTYKLAKMDDKSPLAHNTLIDLIRRVNDNEDSSTKAQQDINNMIFWWIEVRSFLNKQIPMLFDPSEYD